MDAVKREKIYTEEDYYNTPDGVRAELIDGELIYNMAPPSRIHQTILSELHLSIGNYIKAKKGGCHIYPAPFSVKLRQDKTNIVEPDLSIICDKDKLTDKGCTGAPDWVIEITSPSNSSHDYVKKLNLYMDAGVREYWIIDPQEEKIVVYLLEEKQFKMTTYSFTDTIQVSIYDDLSIDFSEITEALAL
ncbi:MAG: Uma2 family endonuclease [Lachnospiraceae bacterium]|nr:Uma2 family endonuclease [Lachnospiraceae bacterium]